MKYVRAIALAALIAITGCAGIRAQQAARTARVQAARTAEYSVSREQLVQALLGVITHKYTIEGYDGDRGRFDTQWANEQRAAVQYRVKVAAQIVGQQPPFRVEFVATVRQQDQQSGWTVGDGRPYEDELYVALYEELGKPAPANPTP